MPRRTIHSTVTGVVGAILALTIAGPLHLALTPHVYRGEVGSLVEAGHDHDHDHHDGEPNETPPHSDGPCVFALLLDAPGATPVAFAVCALPAPALAPAADRAASPGRRPIAIISLAPSHSPPSSV